MKEVIKKIVIIILTFEARLVLKKYKPMIIAVTGSVGKTSTKDAMYAALLPFVHVRKSAKSYNSDLGIPLTILGLPNAWNDVRGWLSNIARGIMLVIKKADYPEWLILEIGADHPGEIEQVMKWVHPDISVITRIGEVPVHVERYKSVKEVVREKSFLAKGVKPDGFIILNADDADVMSFKELTNAQVITFGVNENADIRGTYMQPTYDTAGKLTGISFKIDVDGSSIPIALNGIIGKTHVYPVLASFAVIKALSFNTLSAQSSFAAYDYPRGRMNIIDGLNGSVIIDDTYNASPVALEEAVLGMEDVKVKGRKIGVIGDMLELGRHSAEEHARLGALAGKVFDELFLVGIRARDMREHAIKSGIKKANTYLMNTASDAGEFLRSFVREGDLVLVKGSQGMRMERVVERIMEHTELKGKLLIRQEQEWQSRA